MLLEVTVLDQIEGYDLLGKRALKTCIGKPDGEGQRMEKKKGKK